ncbi:hypothetical protein J2X56_001105 [Herbaspirillum sp. 1173]|uniref:hypothetical protein n=1 Tax=Herbaspirillum sp. 1173 TaxID=2817734 RepID=UPI002860087C|nr:hypothetical protein [Herbaspirillum sp. 1173]MDR6739119.1 hypothetical protein [Herbaspirillum sp. 1173]
MPRPTHFSSQSKPTFQLIQGGFQDFSEDEYTDEKLIRTSATWHVRQFDTVKKALRAVLEARITPTKSVEAACHMNLDMLDEHESPSPSEYLADTRLMLSAGLQKCGEFELPAHIKICDVNLFLATFPHLANVVPIMLAHQGVQPYTNGEPASADPIEIPAYESMSLGRWKRQHWFPTGRHPMVALGHHKSVEEALSTVLKAKLHPTLTVEAASNLPRPSGRRGKYVTPEMQQAQRCMLMAAGLNVETSGKLPPGIVLTNPDAFVRKFPHLEILVGVMVAYGGVQPYTGGQPRRPEPKGVRKQRKAIAA